MNDPTRTSTRLNSVRFTADLIDSALTRDDGLGLTTRFVKLVASPATSTGLQLEDNLFCNSTFQLSSPDSA